MHNAMTCQKEKWAERGRGERGEGKKKMGSKGEWALPREGEREGRRGGGNGGMDAPTPNIQGREGRKAIFIKAFPSPIFAAAAGIALSFIPLFIPIQYFAEAKKLLRLLTVHPEEDRPGLVRGGRDLAAVRARVGGAGVLQPGGK